MKEFTTEEMSTSIANMLGWIDKEGDTVIPRHLSYGYDYPEWADVKSVEYPEYYEGCKMGHYINVDRTGFQHNSEWQNEALQFIITEKGGFYTINQFRKYVSVRMGYIGSTDTDIIYVAREDGNLKETIFEALFKFSHKIK